MGPPWSLSVWASRRWSWNCSSRADRSTPKASARRASALRTHSCDPWTRRRLACEPTVGCKLKALKAPNNSKQGNSRIGNLQQQMPPCVHPAEALAPRDVQDGLGGEAANPPVLALGVPDIFGCSKCLSARQVKPVSRQIAASPKRACNLCLKPNSSVDMFASSYGALSKKRVSTKHSSLASASIPSWTTTSSLSRSRNRAHVFPASVRAPRVSRTRWQVLMSASRFQRHLPSGLAVLSKRCLAKLKFFTAPLRAAASPSRVCRSTSAWKISAMEPGQLRRSLAMEFLLTTERRRFATGRHPA